MLRRSEKGGRDYIPTQSAAKKTCTAVNQVCHEIRRLRLVHCDVGSLIGDPWITPLCFFFYIENFNSLASSGKIKTRHCVYTRISSNFYSIEHAWVPSITYAFLIRCEGRKCICGSKSRELCGRGKHPRVWGKWSLGIAKKNCDFFNVNHCFSKLILNLSCTVWLLSAHQRPNNFYNYYQRWVQRNRSILHLRNRTWNVWLRQSRPHRTFSNYDDKPVLREFYKLIIYEFSG